MKGCLEPAGIAAALRCSLCGEDDGQAEIALAGCQWRYFRCHGCDLIYRHPETFLAPVDEARHYALHENQVGDPGYLRFLQPTIDLVTAYFAGTKVVEQKPGGPETTLRGLDYGCGPGPALAFELRRLGFEMGAWDPIFADEPTVLKDPFDFITCTEVIEHFHSPKQEFKKLFRLLKPNGRLIIRTVFHHDQLDFQNWYYRRDPTHVSFYSEKTFRGLSRFLDFSSDFAVSFPAANHVCIQRKTGPPAAKE